MKNAWLTLSLPMHRLGRVATTLQTWDRKLNLSMQDTHGKTVGFIETRRRRRFTQTSGGTDSNVSSNALNRSSSGRRCENVLFKLLRAVHGPDIWILMVWWFYSPPMIRLYLQYSSLTYCLNCILSLRCSNRTRMRYRGEWWLGLVMYFYLSPSVFLSLW